jgi:transketolase
MHTRELTRRIRDRILELAVAGQEGHIGSSFSIVEILVAILMGSAKAEGRLLHAQIKERMAGLVLSKGHAALALYAVLQEAGVLTDEDLKGFASSGSKFGGHPTRLPEYGIQVSTGSLGHGLPVAAGMAFASLQSGDAHRYICLCGDGELNEGSIWESLLLISKFSLGNLTVVVDDNGSSTRAIDLGSIANKLAAFGLTVQEVDGHNVDDLVAALRAAEETREPTAIVAKTTKGFGSSVTRNNFSWHHRVPTPDDMRAIRQGYEE